MKIKTLISILFFILLSIKAGLSIYFIFAILFFLSFSVIIYSNYQMRRRKKKFLETCAKEDEANSLEEKIKGLFRFYPKIPGPYKKHLIHLVAFFLQDKKFIQHDSLSLDEESKIMIATQACLLIMNRQTDCFGKLREIHLFKNSVPIHKYDKGLVTDSSHGSFILAGFLDGMEKVYLSIDIAKEGALDFSDGENLVIHEFSHYLDQEDGFADGRPLILDLAWKEEWFDAFGEEVFHFNELLEFHDRSNDVDLNKKEGWAEYFAVVCEIFFECPLELKESCPRIYDELFLFFRLNPAEWHSEENVSEDFQDFENLSENPFIEIPDLNKKAWLYLFLSILMLILGVLLPNCCS